MKRFMKAMATTAIPLALVAAVLAVVVPGQAQDDQVPASTLAQTDDEAAEVEDTARGVAAPTGALAGVARLLEVLAVSGEPTAATAGDQRVFLTRDPFNPVVIEADSGNLGSGDDIDGGGTDGGGTDGGGTDGGGTDGGAATDACSGDENETVCEGRVVTVDDVSAAEARVVVDGAIFTVGVGDEFATSFRVLALDPPCVTMLYGDEAFTLCTGVTVLK